jgi:hypothetical protein
MPIRGDRTAIAGKIIRNGIPRDISFKSSGWQRWSIKRDVSTKSIVRQIANTLVLVRLEQRVFELPVCFNARR